MKKLSIAYFGSSYFSADFLEKLLTNQSINRLIDTKFVVTQPDKKVGRKQILTPTPVKQIASKYKIQTIEVGRWKMGIEAGQENRSKKIEKNPTSNFQLPNPYPNLSFILKSLDLVLVFAYGSIIPQELLTLPKYGFWCLHPSLLPKYRGTSPMATALINGDKETGVTIIKMDEEIDHGPIIAQEKYQILPTDRRPDLEKKLTELGFLMFKKLLMKGEDTFFETIARGPRGGKPLLKEQDHSKTTYTKKLSKQDGFVEISKLKNQISKNSEELLNLFRGLTPWPGIWTMVEPSRLRRSETTGKPGRLNEKRLKIVDMVMIDGQLVIKKVQLEGKNEVDFETFNKAYKVF
ncbi:MAG: methionyl-tRNA formyltransferase [Patescibacteria group bacterium]|mgnify:CR=1 FL=1